MAIGHSMAHVRLMGADSRKRADICLTADPPEPALWRVFCCLRRPSFEFKSGFGRKGDPDPGARVETRAPEARGPPEGTAREQSRGPPMAGRTKEGSLDGARFILSAAT